MKRAFFGLILTAVFASSLASPALAAKVPPAPKRPPATTRTITDLVLASGQHDRVYNRVTFRSSRSHQKATVTIARAHHITFRNCVFEGSDWNGISVNDRNRSVHHIRFVNCYVKASARMGFECTSRGSRPGYIHVDLRGVTFDPQGSQAVSFDGPGSHCLLANVWIKGAGTNPNYPWGHGLEINGPTYMTVNGLLMCQTRDSAFNLSGKGIDSHWTFNRVRADMTKRYQRVPQDPYAQVIYATEMCGSKWTNTLIRSAAPGGGVACLDDCHYNDMRGITWRDARGGGYVKPRITDGSSHNRY